MKKLILLLFSITFINACVPLFNTIGILIKDLNITQSETKKIAKVVDSEFKAHDNFISFFKGRDISKRYDLSKDVKKALTILQKDKFINLSKKDIEKIIELSKISGYIIYYDWCKKRWQKVETNVKIDLKGKCPKLKIYR